MYIGETLSVQVHIYRASMDMVTMHGTRHGTWKLCVSTGNFIACSYISILYMTFNLVHDSTIYTVGAVYSKVAVAHYMHALLAITSGSHNNYKYM